MLTSSRVKVGRLGVVLGARRVRSVRRGPQRGRRGHDHRRRLLYLRGPAWPSNSSGLLTTIPVCFDQNVPNATTHFTDNSIRTRTTVLISWSAVAKLRLQQLGTVRPTETG